MTKLNDCLDCIRSPTIKESRSDVSIRKISENSSDKYSSLITSPLSTKKITVYERIQESIGYLEEDRQNYLEVINDIVNGNANFHFRRREKLVVSWRIKMALVNIINF